MKVRQADEVQARGLQVWPTAAVVVLEPFCFYFNQDS